MSDAARPSLWTFRPRHASEFDAMAFVKAEYWRLSAERRRERTSRESREALISIAPTQGYGWPGRPRLAQQVSHV